MRCRQCGHENESGANFCSSCGQPLPREEEATLSLAELADRLELDEELGEALAELPAGIGMLVVRRGPERREPVRARRRRSPPSAGTPTPTSSSTTSPSRAATPPCRGPTAATRSPTSASLNGTYVDHQRVDACAAAPPRRPPDRPVRARVPRRRSARMSHDEAMRDHLSIGEVLAELQRRVPRHHDLEDPVPREPGAHRPRAHAVGLPEVLRRRPHAAALDPVPAEGELPAAEGDQGAPRRAVPSELAQLDTIDAVPGEADGSPRSSRSTSPATEVLDVGRRRAPRPGRRPTPATGARQPAVAAEPPTTREAPLASARARRRPTGAARPRSRRRCRSTTAPTTRASTPPRTPTTWRPATSCAGRRASTAAQVAQLEELRPGRAGPRGRRRRARSTTTRSRSATIAAGFFARGIEARHLRMYRTFAEREAVLFGQVLLPVRAPAQPRGPRARLQEELVELATPRAPAAHGAAPRRGARHRSPSERARPRPSTLLDEVGHRRAASHDLGARDRRRPSRRRRARRRAQGRARSSSPTSHARIPDVDVAVDFIAISRYAPDSGRVRILHDVDLELARARRRRWSRTSSTPGSRSRTSLEHLGRARAAPLDVCTLLDRPVRRIVPLEVRYVGRDDPRRVRARLRAAPGRPVPERAAGRGSRPRVVARRCPTPTSTRSTARRDAGRAPKGPVLG